MRVVSLHADVLLVTSAIWQTNCVIVRGTVRPQADSPVTIRIAGEPSPGAETFVIDSPVLPEELEALPALLDQAGFPPPSGLLATHADWDHLLGRLAFPEAPLGCAASTALRLSSELGAAQRELRAFDRQHYLVRPAPLSLGAVQALEAPGSCEIGAHELALHPAEGHTADGMTIWAPWAGVLVLGDYLSTVEIPVLGDGGSIDAYVATLERLRPLVAEAQFVVPGHGPVLGSGEALSVLGEDLAYLEALSALGASAELPDGRRSEVQRAIHADNVARLG
jgi:glyoxylase-like metal-dependent hydrolase (beta-lactamase superfamily II)